MESAVPHTPLWPKDSTGPYADAYRKNNAVVFRQTLSLLVLLHAQAAAAAGFAVASQGAESLGLAGAATARGDVDDAGFYNPAAWALRPGLFAAAGATWVQAALQHSHPATGDHRANTPAALPPYLYLAESDGEFSVSLAGNIPFGSGLSWAEDWPGRFEVTAISLRAYEASAAAALRLGNLAASAGVRVLPASVSLSRRIDAVASEGSVTVEADGFGWGGQASLLWRPPGGFAVGASYRSQVRLHLEGNANFADVPVELAARAHDGPASTTLTLPDRAALGTSYQHGQWTASADLEWTHWSLLRAIEIDFLDAATPDVSQPRQWQDVFAFHLGAEFAARPDLSLRAGIAYDQSPAPAATLSPSSPDGDRVLASVGASYRLGPVGLHLAYAHTFIGSRVVAGDSLPGRYEASADLLSLGVGTSL
jgi:long-chain fatty acid transport protein